MVNFSASIEERELISQIVDRYRQLRVAKGGTIDRRGRRMDIEACHCNGTPLDLAKLLAFDDFNFLHDVGGIVANLNRGNGKLMRQFLPRCARPQASDTPAHRHAPTEPAQMVRYRAHPDPEIAAARLRDLRDLGATRVATRMSTALQMPSVGDALEFVHREIVDCAELISAAAATNLADEHLVLRAVAAVLADLVDDMTPAAEVADART